MHTGMRRGELAGLRWKDIDLSGSTLTVAQQRTMANYEVVAIKPKGKSQRQLQLADSTVAVLTEHRKRQRLERVAVGPAWTDTGYVFVDELGKPYLPQIIYAMFVCACKRADVPAIRLYELRHTMATLSPPECKPASTRRSSRSNSATAPSTSPSTSTPTSPRW